MRIALVADHLSPRPGTARDTYPASPADRVLCLAVALTRLGADVTIYTRKDPAEPGSAAGSPPPAPGQRGSSRSGVRVVCLSAGTQDQPGGDPPQPAAFADGLAACWRRGAPDVVHAHSPASALAALPGAGELGIPVALSSGFAGHRRSAQPGGRLDQAIGDGIDALLAATSAERAGPGRLGVARGAVRLLPPGVDTGRFCPSGPVARRGERPRLLVVTDFADQRPLATLLHTLASLPGAELVIAGGPARARLASDPGCASVTGLSRRLGLANRVTCTGRLSQGSAPALLRSADVLLSLTAAEPFALVPVEAMACGTPVVALAAGLQRDAVIDGATGVLLPPGQPGQPGPSAALLAGRLRQLLASPMLLEGYGIAAACRARDRYSWERIAAETLAVYDALCQPRTETAA